MCGYCTETAVLSDLLDEMKDESLETHAPFLYPGHLQEASDWRKELRSWDGHDHPRGALVALCRHWSERIAGMTPIPLGEVLSAGALAELQNWLVTMDCSSEWPWKQCVDGRRPNPPSIELARARLDAYVNDWILPSPFDTAVWDQKKLHERFLGTSIAFDVVVRFAPDDMRLKLLAILSPRQTPFFDGLDLWLQRRALHACVAHSGVRFISEHLDELRIEAILSVVISDLLTRGDLLKLQSSLQGRFHNSLNLRLRDLFDAVATKINRLGP